MKPVYKKGAKARKYRDGGRGPYPDRQEATAQANRPNTPAAERPSRPATQSSSSSSSSTRLSYAEAKKKDPKLDSYIKARKQFKKGSDDYNKYQNLINKAYGVSKRRPVKNDGKIETKKATPIPTKKPELATRTKPAASKPAAKKPVARKTTSGGSGMGSVNQKKMSDIIAETKGTSASAPSRNKRQQRRDARKSDRAAVQGFRKAMRKARRG